MLLNSLIIATDGIISEEGLESILSNHKEDLLRTYLTGLHSVDTRVFALEGLKRLIIQKAVLNEDGITQVIDTVNEVLEREGDNEATRFVQMLITNLYCESDYATGMLYSIFWSQPLLSRQNT